MPGASVCGHTDAGAGVDAGSESPLPSPSPSPSTSTPIPISRLRLTTTAPITIASYIEAQLILAEATGGSGAITILNNLRASVSGLAPLAASSDPAVVTADIAQERARWLWLQGTHLYDVRRLGLPLVPAAARVRGNFSMVSLTQTASISPWALVSTPARSTRGCWRQRSASRRSHRRSKISPATYSPDSAQKT